MLLHHVLDPEEVHNYCAINKLTLELHQFEAILLDHREEMSVRGG